MYYLVAAAQKPSHQHTTMMCQCRNIVMSNGIESLGGLVVVQSKTYIKTSTKEGEKGRLVGTPVMTALLLRKKRKHTTFVLPALIRTPPSSMRPATSSFVGKEGNEDHNTKKTPRKHYSPSSCAPQ